MAHPRDTTSRVQAYLARPRAGSSSDSSRRCCGASCRAPARSNGEVGPRLIYEREAVRRSARAMLDGGSRFRHARRCGIAARLTHLDNRSWSSSTCRTRPWRCVPGKRSRRVASPSARSARQHHPPPPFTTSTLQQEASRKLGFAAQQTMRLAQQLYEGIDIGGETTGLITYSAPTACRWRARRSPRSAIT